MTDIGNKDIKLKSLNTNANSLMNKVTEVKFRTTYFDIISIVEIWTNSSVSDDEVSIQGYNLFRVDKKEAQGVGDGLILYIKDSLNATCCKELSDHPFTQSLWCTVEVKVGSLPVGLCNRSLSSNTITIQFY